MKASLAALVAFLTVLPQRRSPVQIPSSLMTSTQVLRRLGAIHWETGPQMAASIERKAQTTFPTLTRSCPRSRR